MTLPGVVRLLHDEPYTYRPDSWLETGSLFPAGMFAMRHDWCRAVSSG